MSYLHQDELVVRDSSISCHLQAAVFVGSEQEILEL